VGGERKRAWDGRRGAVEKRKRRREMEKGSMICAGSIILFFVMEEPNRRG